MRTLIVDDEHFVRKGLILTVPWEQFGFEVVGEAENGQKALQIMSTENIEVLFTDLTMPKMSGFELMREVRKFYPDTSIVVLTCHQEFQYAIEAMQCGAIDYLVKTQIEEGKMEEALTRIEMRIKEGASNKGREATPPWELILVQIVPERHPRHISWGSEPGFIPIRERWFHVIDHGLIVWQEVHKLWEKQGLYQTWIPVIFDATHLRSSFRVNEWTDSIKEEIFYHYQALHPSPIHFTPRSLDHEDASQVKASEMDNICRTFAAMQWIYDTNLFHTWLKMVEEHRPISQTIQEITDLFFEAISYLKRMREFFVHAGNHRELNWHDLCSLLTKLRPLLQYSGFSEEVTLGIYKALLFMQRELSSDLNQEKVAQSVALSRSYFGQCFRPIVGLSFHELLTEMRIRRAEALLIESNEFIYVIAEKAGFQDEKYFSKVFKQRLGILPKEYRERSRVEAAGGK